ncbi:MAG: HAD family hydrolase [Oscillospiraceae bacterium]|nr:HAD family hydrolase [Oscillospiraceae bacterium]
MSAATIILDYDGTLHDCIRIYAPAFRLAYDGLVRKGLMPPRTWQDKELEHWLGLTATEMWDTFAPQLSQEERTAAGAVVGTEMVRQITIGNARLYPGVTEVLDRMKQQGHRLVFLSNCRTAYMQAHRDAFGLDDWFSGFYCSEDFGWKSKPEVFLTIRERFPGPYIAVGDRYKDMDLARVYGLKAVGCAYGYGPQDELSDASVIVQSPAEIPDAVDTLLS